MLYINIVNFFFHCVQTIATSEAQSGRQKGSVQVSNGAEANISSIMISKFLFISDCVPNIICQPILFLLLKSNMVAN